MKTAKEWAEELDASASKMQMLDASSVFELFMDYAQKIQADAIKSALELAATDIGGIDIRTYIATAAMQGILANYIPRKAGTVARDAVMVADALIAELNKDKK